MGLKTRTSKGIYLGIAQGNITQKADKDDPLAIAREYEDDNGNKKVVYEHQFSELTGLLQEVKFRDGKFGEEWMIVIKDVDETYILTIKTGDRYFQDFGKKVRNIDLSEEITLSPFDFEGDNGNPVRGISITQGGEKVMNFYYDAENKKDINGFPSVTAKERKEFDSDDWKMYFIKVKKFLKKEIQAIKFAKLATDPADSVKHDDIIKPAEGTEDEADDLPF